MSESIEIYGLPPGLINTLLLAKLHWYTSVWWYPRNRSAFLLMICFWGRVFRPSVDSTVARVHWKSEHYFTQWQLVNDKSIDGPNRKPFSPLKMILQLSICQQFPFQFVFRSFSCDDQEFLRRLAARNFSFCGICLIDFSSCVVDEKPQKCSIWILVWQSLMMHHKPNSTPLLPCKGIWWMIPLC